MFRIAPVLSITLAILVFVAGLSAQKSSGLTTGAAIKPAAGESKIDRLQSRQVAIELERQQEFLQTVTSRFEAVAVNDFTPLFKYSYVWTALRENRTQIEKPVRLMTKDQSTLFAKGYDVLEKEVVASFGDHQLGILNDALELNDMQFQDIQMAVEDDLSARRDLLKSKDLSNLEFVRRINAISESTETKILALLFPEQRKTFERQLNFTRDRLVG